MILNQAERRRKKLLEHTRTLYDDSKAIPAIHPRYKSTYQQLYDNDNKAGSFGIRFILSIILLFGYVLIKYNSYNIYGIGDMQVLKMIMQNHY